MRLIWLILVGLTGACSQAALPPTGGGEVYPVAGLYSVTGTDPEGQDAPPTEVYKTLNTRAQFVAFLGDALGHSCDKPEGRIANGSFDLEAKCETPDGDFRNFPVRVSGTWTADQIDLTSEITLFDTPLQSHTTYQLIETNKPAN